MVPSRSRSNFRPYANSSMTSRLWVPLLPITLVLLGSAGAQQRDALVSVSHSNSGVLSVQIKQVGKLQPVLRELCQQTKAECEISALAASDAAVVPMTISGSWTQVISKLLEGTGFNFAATNSSRAHEFARLVVQARPVGADPYVPPAA